MIKRLTGAIISAVLVALWINLHRDTIGTHHQPFYFNLPFVFLLIPFLALIAEVRAKGRPMPASGCMLAGNFLLFLLYATMSGGGI